MTTPGLAADAAGVPVCWWAAGDPLYEEYHGQEWGRGSPDDAPLLEKLCLEGFQAGLSWITVLRKRPRFREVFHGFDPARVAAMGSDDVAALLEDAGIIRHRGKIESTINNARRAVEMIRDEGSIFAFVRPFAPSGAGAPAAPDDVAATTPESVALSKELKRRGWSFVGPTTAYAFMQAMGLVNDHIVGCSVRDACEELRLARYG